MLRPVTADVMDPRLIAASAVVEMCPTEITGTNTRLYSTSEALVSIWIMDEQVWLEKIRVLGVLTLRWGMYNEE